MAASMGAVLRFLIILSATLALVSTSPTFASSAQVKRSVDDLLDSYDYVVIGGGTSGLVVANRLSEDPSSKSVAIKQCVSLLNIL
jgi:ribulose 1,5-bisphosphate synthetase/thiazole synthase